MLLGLSFCGSRCTGFVVQFFQRSLTQNQQEFIEAIDGIDNGVSQYPTDIQPLYKSRTDLSSRVSHLNPAWNQPVDAQAVDVSVMSSYLIIHEINLGPRRAS